MSCCNWEYDLYMRIDAELLFNASIKSAYISEINWCYRLGYINEDAREHLLEYLDDAEIKTSQNQIRVHELRQKNIIYNQNQLREKKARIQAITEVFRGMR